MRWTHDHKRCYVERGGRVKFRKKPVVIEAVQWRNDLRTIPDEFYLHPHFRGTNQDSQLVISTMEGTMLANIGDWLIIGVAGELYPCKPDIFEQTYEKVDA